MCRLAYCIFVSEPINYEERVFSRELVGVARISIHVTVRVGRPSVGEKVHYLVYRFLVG
jgi:hypothetical protein